MSPRKYSAAALLLIATCTIATALAPRFSGTATAAVLAWPVDLTYELTQRQGDTVFTSTHRFVGTGWNDWRDEVLELERTGPLTDETTVPAGPGSSTTYLRTARSPPSIGSPSPSNPRKYRSRTPSSSNRAQPGHQDGYSLQRPPSSTCARSSPTQMTLCWMHCQRRQVADC